MSARPDFGRAIPRNRGFILCCYGHPRSLKRGKINYGRSILVIRAYFRASKKGRQDNKAESYRNLFFCSLINDRNGRIAVVSSRKPSFGSSEICILAGGLCSRMGRDKARLRLGNRTLLSHIRKQAEDSTLPVRIIRNDVVERCGPLGGIYTALVTSNAEGILFLSCDMPFISAGLLKALLNRVRQKMIAIFFETDEGVCFPFWLRNNTLSAVQEQLARHEFSLQALAARLDSNTIRASASQQDQLFNINTPADWDIARRLWHSRFSKGA